MFTVNHLLDDMQMIAFNDTMSTTSCASNLRSARNMILSGFNVFEETALENQCIL